MGAKVEIGIGVTLGIPTYGRLVNMQWVNAYKMMNPPINYNMRVAIVENRLVADARNEIARVALKAGSRYVLFLGDDVVVPPYTMQKLIYRMENMDELGVVGGIYCSKADTPAPLVFRGNGTGSYWKWKIGEFFSVTGLGMDCTLIRTDVFKALEPPWFETKLDDEYESGVNNAESWTEDLWFCKRVLEETDYTIYADASIICDHWDFANRRKFTLPSDSYPVQRLENPKKMLDLGSGMTVWEFEGEGRPMRVDIREETEPDYRCDLRDLPFEDGQFDVIFSSHVLEHFDRNEVDKVLDEWLRVLAPGGEARLCVPNLEWAAKNLVDGILDVNTMNVLYGQQDYAYNFHKFGFTPKSLRMMLEHRGMEIIEEKLDYFHIMMRALKPKSNGGKISKQRKVSKKKKELEEGLEINQKTIPDRVDDVEMQLAPLQKTQPRRKGSGGTKRRKSQRKES